jgi:hypothetical protein
LNKERIVKKFVYTMLLAALALGCSKEESKQETTATEKPTDAPPATEVAKKEKAPAPAIDERLKPHFEAGKDCKWDKYGMAMCDASSEIRKFAFENQSDSKLAASCAACLTHDDATIRGLAAECMGGFNDSARIPHLAAGLDAFEAEKSPELRTAIAKAFSNGNAKESGVEDRVIALVRKLAKEPDGMLSASYLIDSMFPSYLMQATESPSKAAGDLAIEMAPRNDRLGERALAALSKLNDRGPEACKVIVEIAQGDNWTSAVESMCQIKGVCADGLDPVINHIADQLAKGKFNLSEYSATKQLLKRATLTKKQLKKLQKASRVLVKKARKTSFAKASKELAKAMKKYKPPKG